VAAGSRDGAVRVLASHADFAAPGADSTSTALTCIRVLPAQSGWVADVAFLGHPSVLATADENDVVAFWDLHRDAGEQPLVRTAKVSRGQVVALGSAEPGSVLAVTSEAVVAFR
jgi:WD40 repeat protein